jgi:hypothetical protein
MPYKSAPRMVAAKEVRLLSLRNAGVIRQRGAEAQLLPADFTQEKRNPLWTDRM